MRTGGWVLVAGAAVFLLVAFAPASYVFGITDLPDRRRHLAKHARSWRWGQLPFAGGAVVSAVGLLVLGAHVEGGHGTAVLVAGVVATLASLPWAESCRLRALHVDDFLEGRLPGWHFQVYVWATLAALVVTGIALLGTPAPAWAAWTTLVGGLLLAAAMAGLKDVPPFLFYLLTGALGIALLA